MPLWAAAAALSWAGSMNAFERTDLMSGVQVLGGSGPSSRNAPSSGTAGTQAEARQSSGQGKDVSSSSGGWDPLPEMTSASIDRVCDEIKALEKEEAKALQEASSQVRG